VVLKNAGLTDLRIHDLRRSMGSWMQAQGANLRTIQHGLGHGQIATTAKAYAVSEVEQVRQAMAGVSAAILKAAE
jgi:site-specific recombinase XerD